MCLNTKLFGVLKKKNLCVVIVSLAYNTDLFRINDQYNIFDLGNYCIHNNEICIMAFCYISLLNSYIIEALRAIV